jgi:hypothetical protein
MAPTLVGAIGFPGDGGNARGGAQDEGATTASPPGAGRDKTFPHRMGRARDTGTTVPRPTGQNGPTRQEATARPGPGPAGRE